MENNIEQNIQDLQNQLKELNLKKDYDSLIEKYNELKEKFEGKCFASKGLRIHSLGNYTKLHNLDLCKCTKVCISDGFYADSREYVINSFNDYKSINFKQDLRIRIICENITIYVYNDDVSIDIRKETIYNPKDFPCFKYEIDETVYNNIKHITTQSIDNILSYPVKGAYTYMPSSTKTQELKKLGYKFVTIDSDEAYILSAHPFVYENELLVSETSIQILQNIIKETERLDNLDVNDNFAGYTIKRSGIYKRQLDKLYSVIDRVQNAINVWNYILNKFENKKL
jgi:flagellar biosynthesis chaperone FliJ